jgi:hypothetical protein
LPRIALRSIRATTTCPSTWRFESRPFTITFWSASRLEFDTEFVISVWIARGGESKRADREKE